MISFEKPIPGSTIIFFSDIFFSSKVPGKKKLENEEAAPRAACGCPSFCVLAQIQKNERNTKTAFPRPSGTGKRPTGLMSNTPPSSTDRRGGGRVSRDPNPVFARWGGLV